MLIPSASGESGEVVTIRTMRGNGRAVCTARCGIGRPNRSETGPVDTRIGRMTAESSYEAAESGRLAQGVDIVSVAVRLVPPPGPAKLLGT